MGEGDIFPTVFSYNQGFDSHMQDTEDAIVLAKSQIRIGLVRKIGKLRMRKHPLFILLKRISSSETC